MSEDLSILSTHGLGSKFALLRKVILHPISLIILYYHKVLNIGFDDNLGCTEDCGEFKLTGQ
jgi:hypothetical protein